MVGTRFLRMAALALTIYGLLGLLIAAAIFVVGSITYGQINALSTTLESERTALVSSIHTASATLRDTSKATADFQQSIDTAQAAANQASSLANDSAGTFRDMATSVKSLNVFGLQPLAGLGPQFDHSADQLQQLAISLGSTRQALGQNGSDVGRVATDLNQLQSQLDAVAASLTTPGVLGLDTSGMLPFQVAFYGMCLLVLLQSGFSIIVGVVLFRLSRALGGAPLFPHAQRRAALPPTTAGSGASEAKVEKLSLTH